MNTPSVTLPPNLFSAQEQKTVQEIIQHFNPQQLQWLAGYLTGLQHSNQQLLQLINRIPVPQESITMEPVAAGDNITVLYGSKSGNSKKIAKNLHDKLIARGFTSSLQDMNVYQGNRLKEEKWLLVVVSTHGEGDPPPAAEDLHAYITGRKAPALPETKFAVLALGDKSYASYCQTGRDFDRRLGELKGTRLLDRVEADVDYEETAEAWIETVINKVQEGFGNNRPAPATLNGHAGTQPAVAKATPSYNRKNPFLATVLENVQLNGRGSAKETYHLELSLEESGLEYQPGDTLGVWVENHSSLVEAILQFKNYSPETVIEINDNNPSLFEFLQKQAEVTTVSGAFLSAYSAFVSDPADAHFLNSLLADKQALSAFVYGKDVLDVLQRYPSGLTAQQFAAILLPLQPRLYSIASSLEAHPEEVHLTVGRVVYQENQREHRGVASNFIADVLKPGQQVPVFIDTNESFRLPENQATPIIMVGPGTGIAPFRAFVEQRAESGAEGKSWLFFGDQHFTTDFLYQVEWQRFLKQGHLTRMNTAFSRDHAAKLYVQHRMKEHAAELYQWLEEGAHFYVCGDAKRMAKDVKNTLQQIVQQEGGLDETAAHEYIRQLIKKGRYQEDTY